MALCVTAVNPAVPAKAEDMLQESEPNGNPATANQLPLNTWMKGKPSDGYDEDWYQFTIQNPGESHIEIRPDASVSYGSCAWYVYLYDANRRKLRGWDAHSWSDYQFGWTPGKYYICVENCQDKCTYNLKVNYTPSNQWEKERYGKKAKVQIFCMYMLCLILYLDKKQSIAVAIGVANLTVGGCVCAGKMKNILLKHKE